MTDAGGDSSHVRQVGAGCAREERLQGRPEALVGGRRAALAASDLGAPLGERATLVQFSTAFCQPCRAARSVLSRTAVLVPGVAHVEVDAESRLELVRAVGIEATPTVLVLDAQGRIVRRASGVPGRDAVLAAIAEALGRDEA